ncbi:MAG: twin-arginine translocase subunit TatC [Nitrospirae bacterium]|nr:twin-arginine translocase subunit TatC [Nitrospirota bacterium]
MSLFGFRRGGEGTMSFLDHLDELRRRLIISLVALFVGMAIAFPLSKEIFEFLAQPLRAALPAANVGIIFTGVGEAFETYMWMSIAAGALIASPVVFWQFWAFVAPGLYQRERKIVLGLVGTCLFLLFAGIAFGYLVALPLVLRFFLSFGGASLMPAPRMGEYLTFIAWFLLIFGFMFQLPLVMVLLSRLGIVNPATFSKNRSYAIVIILIIAAILTPPDAVSMIVLAAPVLLLYEIGILASKVLARKHNR